MTAEYIGGWTAEHLERALSKVVPTCQHCNGKCTFLCIEQCCVGSDLFCIDCDKQHWLHRKNEFRVLLVNRHQIKSRACNLKDNLGELVEYFRLERQLNERTIQFYQRLHEMYLRAIDELEVARAHFAEEQSCNERMTAVMERVLTDRWVSQEDREEFGRYVRSLNLYDEPFTRLQSISNLSSLLDSERGSTQINTSKLSKVLERIRQVATRCRNCLENFVVSTNIQQYLTVSSSPSNGYDFNTIDRSLELTNDQKVIGTLKARRAIVARNPNGTGSLSFTTPIQSRISELHTECSLESIPQTLQSLSYLNLFHPVQGTGRNFSMKQLPESLKSLRLAMNMEVRLRIPYQLDHLRNLRTLYLVDGGIGAQDLRYVIEFAKRQKLRLLVIMGFVLRNGCRNVRSYWCKIETCYNHRFERLRRHYIVSKRKMLQVAYLQRNLVLRDHQHFVEGVLDACGCSFDEELQREVLSGALKSSM